LEKQTLEILLFAPNPLPCFTEVPNTRAEVEEGGFEVRVKNE
jgi:hypothetical protein